MPSGGELRHKSWSATAIAGAVLSAMVPAAAFTQAAPGGGLQQVPSNVPSSVTGTAQEIRREPTTPVAPPSNVTVITRGALQRGPCPAALVESPLTVPLTSVTFTGTGGAPLAPELASLLKGIGRALIGTTQPIRMVCEVRDQANATLAAAGYVAAVRVPEQTVESGKLILEVVTARIVELRVRGEAGRSRRRIEGLLGRLKALDPLNQRSAERVLLLAGDIPGIAVTLELSPATNGAPGEVIGDVTVERIPGTLLFNVQDYGSKQIGRYAGLARAELYGLTGLGDRTFVSLFSTSDFKEQRVVQVGHDFLLTNGGLRFGGEFTYAWTKPSLEQFGGSIDLRSEALLATVQATQPVVRNLGKNLNAAIGFDLINQRVKTGAVPINLDKLRVVFARLNGDIVDRVTNGLAPKYHFGLGIELRKGTGLLDATKRGGGGAGGFPTRFEGDPQAFELRGNFSTELRKRFGPLSPYAVTAAAEVRGQWANHPLLAFEELSVGNLTIGRGYDPGATSGDRLVGGIFEIRAGKPQALSRTDFAYEAIAFYDAVRLWNLDTGSVENNRQLRSVGGGARVSWGDHARLEIVYAHPMDRAQSFDDKKASNRLLVSLVFRALPWRR